MKVVSGLILAGCLLGVATLAQACPGKQRGECATDVMLKQMDKDGDGTISKAEFAAYQDARFLEMDSNKDGKISKEELENSMQKYGPLGDRCATRAKMKPIQP